MQITRLFEIVYILLNQNSITASKLANKFEVSIRTIYRDIETLSACGIPVYMQKGRGGGISLMPNFVLNKALLTSDERTEILSALNAVKNLGIEKSFITSKLTSLLGVPSTNWLEVDFSHWSNEKEQQSLFESLKSAIISQTTVKFIYSATKGETLQRLVYPLKLCFKHQDWYLYAYCTLRNDYRFFKLSRIKGFELTSVTFSMPSPENVTEKMISYKSEDNVELVMIISQKLAYKVYDEFEDYTQNANGDFIVKSKVENCDWLFNYILSFGTYCEVLEPKSLRLQVKNALEQTLEKYK